jgi:hypothetical protein
MNLNGIIVPLNIKAKVRLVVVLLSIFAATACDELVQVDPPITEPVRPSVFESDGAALSALTGIYVKLANGSGFASGGFGSITILIGAYSDELVSYASSGSGIYPFYFNSLDSENTSVSSIWVSSYNIIYLANTVVEGINATKSITPELKNQFKGEALFLRAFVHFYLTNLYGDIPYIRTTDYKVNSTLPRTPVGIVYASMIEDLLEAKSLLSANYPTGTRVRPNKAAATALLARVYLHNGSWAEAEAQATEVINNSTQYTMLQNLDRVFLANSQEAIWQLMPPYQYTNEGSLFILLAPPTFATLRNSFVLSLAGNDLRRLHWVNSISSSSGLTTWYYAFKYKEKINATGAEYSMVLRLAEQYLIRSEARMQQDRYTGDNSAASDLDVIRSRAGLAATTAATKDELVVAIERERQAEFFAEWGHRFFDLKRWNKLNERLPPIKPNWRSDYALLPIPRAEILSNIKLSQNKGY